MKICHICKQVMRDAGIPCIVIGDEEKGICKVCLRWTTVVEVDREHWGHSEKENHL